MFLKDLTEPELRSLDPEKTLVLLGVGGIDVSSGPLSLGATAAVHSKVMERFAARLESELGYRVVRALDFPLSLGGTRGRLHVRGHVLRDYIVDQCKGLRHLGLRRCVVVSALADPKTLTAIEEAAHILRKGGRYWGWSPRSQVHVLPLSSALVRWDEVRRSWFKFKPLGGWEAEDRRWIQRALAVDPAQVRTYYRDLPGLGDASPAEGEAWAQDLVSRWWEPTLSFLSRPKKWKTSGFGLIPWNWSLFGAWMILAALFAIIWLGMLPLLNTYQ